MKGLYAGTFDPLTNGHLDVIKRTSLLVDELVVLIADNALKTHNFTLEERKQMISNVVTNIPNVKIDYTSGLVVNYAKDNNIKVMFRGLRNIQDYEYEYSLSMYNKNINNEIETVLIFPSTSTHFVSSSAIKELVYHDVDISLYIPSVNSKLVKEKLKKKTDV